MSRCHRRPVLQLKLNAAVYAEGHDTGAQQRLVNSLEKWQACDLGRRRH